MIQPFERFYICNKMPREGEILIHSIKTSVFQQNTHFIPSKHARSNPEAFWLWPVMAITASMQPELGRIVYARSDFSHPFQLHFSKEGMDHIVQNRPGSDLDGLVRVWPNASGLEAKASSCAGITRPGFWQDATSLLPVSHFQTQFCSSTDILDNTVPNQPGSNLVLIVSGLGQMDLVQEQASVQESSSLLLENTSQPI